MPDIIYLSLYLQMYKTESSCNIWRLKRLKMKATVFIIMFYSYLKEQYRTSLTHVHITLPTDKYTKRKKYKRDYGKKNNINV